MVAVSINFNPEPCRGDIMVAISINFISEPRTGGIMVTQLTNLKLPMAQ